MWIEAKELGQEGQTVLTNTTWTTKYSSITVSPFPKLPSQHRNFCSSFHIVSSTDQNIQISMQSQQLFPWLGQPSDPFLSVFEQSLAIVAPFQVQQLNKDAKPTTVTKGTTCIKLGCTSGALDQIVTPRDKWPQR